MTCVPFPGRTFTTVSGVALVLGVATAVAWVGEGRDAVYRKLPLREFRVSTGEPSFVLSWRTDDALICLPDSLSYRGNTTAGCYYIEHGFPDDGPVARRWISVPYRCVLWLAAVPVAAWGVQMGRFLRHFQPVRKGFCRCGYDLRATPDRCPECGKVVADDSD